MGIFIAIVCLITFFLYKLELYMDIFRNEMSGVKHSFPLCKQCFDTSISKIKGNSKLKEMNIDLG